MMRLKITTSIVLVYMLLILLSGCGGGQGNASDVTAHKKERLTKVSVIQVQPTPIRDILVLPGQTKPQLDVTVAADEGGRIVWIGPEEGDRIKKNELILKMDVEGLRARLDNAEANRRLAKTLYKRRKLLFENNIISAEELDQNRTQMLTAEGLYRQAKVDYDKGFIRSPIDGIVNHLHVDVGEFVAKGGQVTEVVNVEKIEIDVNVPELDVPYIKTRQPVLVRIDAYPDSQIIGRVDFVAFKADPTTKTFRVKIIVDNQDGSIRPGMITRVYFQKRIITDAIVAPLFALVDKGGERLVYVEKDGVASARAVDLGVIEGDTIQITSGLKAGENLIVSGQNDVQEGTRVQVQ